MKEVLLDMGPQGNAEPKDPEERAAWLAEKHYNTPQVQELDNIGRPFRTRDHNGFDENGDPVYYDVRVELDVQGKRKIVTNPLSQDTVFTYSVLPVENEGQGQDLYTDSPDGGWRRMLMNVQGQPIKLWDERGHEFTHHYDELLRPTEVIVDEGSGDKTVNFMVYGDNAGIISPEDDNLKGQMIRLFDQSGVIQNSEFDFKGNPLTNDRIFASNYKTTVDWSSLTSLSSLSSIDSTASSLLESETFSSSVEYDALDRPTTLTRPDSSEILPTYNEAGMLESVDVKIRGAGTSTTFISDINYNEKGQRTKIVYGNGAQTKYSYSTESFRLTRILTTRNSGTDILQDLNYTFDPVGNITEMIDNAQQTLYFANAVVSPKGKYEYDALYRLIKATGREHYGQGQITNSDFSVNTPVPQNNNSTAVDRYIEQYQYDAIGNILKLIHRAKGGSWTRGYHYDSQHNQLLKTSLPGDTIGNPATYSASYTHDVHGNMTSMPHLSSMVWDFKDQLREADLGGGGTAWYVYDAQGTRVRKVIENGTLTKDRFYLDQTNEYYREYISGSKDYERETFHVMDERKRLAIVETKTWESGSAIGTPSPVIRYPFDNHLGSASLELDTSANIISYEEYHPFGTSSYRLGSSVAEVSLKRYRYVGKERDNESGLYYYGARYYAAWLGRFVSVDPLKDDYPYYTPFQYAGNKPISYIDLDGLEPAGPDPDAIAILQEEEKDHMAFTDSRKERRSVRKYGRKFEKAKEQYLNNTDTSEMSDTEIDNAVHLIVHEKYGDKRWMWIKNKHDSDHGNTHSGFFNAGELYRWYNSSDEDRRSTIAVSGGEIKLLPLPADSIKYLDYRVTTDPGVHNGSISFRFRAFDDSSTMGSTTVTVRQSADLKDISTSNGAKLKEITLPIGESQTVTIPFKVSDGEFITVEKSGEGLSELGSSITTQTPSFRPKMYELPNKNLGRGKNKRIKGRQGLNKDRLLTLKDRHQWNMEKPQDLFKGTSFDYDYAHIIKQTYGF